MKKLLFACGLVAFAACAHKATPTSSTTAAGTTTTSSTTTASTTTPAANSTANAKIEAGHQVFNAKCGRCHGLKDPANYTAERWVPIMQSMAPKAKLTEEETIQVTAYVQANAKK